MATTLIQLLEDLSDYERTIKIPAAEVDRLVNRFGDRIRLMGRWNVGGDRSLEIPEGVLRQAAMELDRDSLAAAIQELKAAQVTKAFDSSSAVCFIEKVIEVYQRHFHDLMTRYQNTKDQGEANRLRDQLVNEVFGS
jgi:hypothetical protein